MAIILVIVVSCVVIFYLVGPKGPTARKKGVSVLQIFWETAAKWAAKLNFRRSK